ncbi:hypothetical protein [Micromonospora sp. WMMD980]|uniref:hypothetical protein n=1 Tax=Micromonospora sp. WMMD980 TaxID=3016088 RepID=UPI0024179D1D|nr:hypothetical protein [Micromonospora sp. WMMD980]MDG4803149.1 hypothetical protein [Micromonospora sp. WMMD980]
MAYEQAVVEVSQAGSATDRRSTAATWARVLAYADDSVPLGTLLGGPSFVDTDISGWCRTRRAQRVLARHDLTHLGKLVVTTLGQLRSIPDCGAVSVDDILEAVLLAVIGDHESALHGILPLPRAEKDQAVPLDAAPPIARQDTPVSDPLLDILESR